MDLRKEIFREFLKNGYAEVGGKRVWNIAQRRFLYFTPELVQGFLNLRAFPLYKKQIEDREVALIKTSIKKISKEIGNESFNLIDIFCGDGHKAREFIRELKSKKNIRYCPLNVSKELVNLASKNIREENFSNVREFGGCVCDLSERYFKKFLVNARSSRYPRNVILLFGSVLASYEINSLLYQLSSMMLPGDYLIVGNGIREGKRLVSLKTYKHDIFNDWMINLMRQIGFKGDEVGYDVRFGNSRVEFFYRVNKERSISHRLRKVKFKKGDEIITAILYKYYPDELKKFCSMYFDEVDLIQDKDGESALIACRK